MPLFTRSILAFVLSFVTSLPAVSVADDTEVFFDRRSAADNNETNVIFMFDTSGSMRNFDDGNYSRMTRMKQAMVDVIDSVDSVNIGMGAFNGWNVGGSILYPATDVNSDVCKNASCDEVSLRVPIQDTDDDGEEWEDGRMSLEETYLDFARGIDYDTSVTLNVPISTGSDDIIQLADGTMLSSGTDINLFGLDEAAQHTVGLRFDKVNIPAGASVVNAFLRLHPKPEDNAGFLSALIDVDSAVDSLPFTESGEGALDARIYDPKETYWYDIWSNDGSSGHRTTTPDISAQIDHIVSQPGWTPGNAITVRIRREPCCVSSISDQRGFRSFESGYEPTLVVEYIPGGIKPNTVGLRFADVQVPRGATINRAFVEFRTAGVDTDPSTLSISGENVGHSEPFKATNGNFSARTSRTAAVDWAVPEWTNIDSARRSVNIKSIIQAITSRADWCGGNALSLLIEGDGLRRALSRDYSIWNAPRLVLDYDPGTVAMNDTCLSQQARSRIVRGNDDATQALTSGPVVDSGGGLSTRAAGAASAIGLRFDDLVVPQGARIRSAYLELRSMEGSASTAGPTITVEDAANAASFVDGQTDGITSRPQAAAQVVWPKLPGLNPGEMTRSPDIGSLISAVTSRSDWIAGNALVLQLRNSDAGAGAPYAAFDNDSISPAQLTVNYQLDDPATSGTSVVMHSARDALRNQVLQLRAEGATPLMDAYFEAAQYMTGGRVAFGKVRGGKYDYDVIFRTSIPSSWEKGGGELYRPEGCTADDLDNPNCINEEVLGDAYYDAPVAGLCQNNQIVMLSDGDGTHNSSLLRIKELTGVDSCVDSDSKECGRELAKWLYELPDDANGFPQSVITHTVGFNFSGNFLRNLASAGGGSFYTANSTVELSSAFRNIISEAVDINTAFVAPSASVSQFNRLVNRDDIYYAMFRPSATARWDGNLKRYRVGKSAGETSSIVLDVNEEAVFDEVTGKIRPQSQSFWSSAPDGASVSLGGAANELTLPRKVKTFIYDESDNPGALIDLSESSSAIDAGLLGIDPADTAYRQRLLKWARGVDVLDFDEDTNTSEVRWQMGDPMHSAPFLINYASAAADGESVVFVGTNEGFLHAIDTKDGSERFSFIPPELLRNLDIFFRDEPDSGRPYGLDGAVAGWIDDTDGDGIVGINDKAYVVVGMRRGGRNYYALDVSNPDAPALRWVIRGGSGDFAELGETWSKPVYTRLRINDVSTEVLIFTGGYDTSNDSRSTRLTADSVGRSLFLVDPATGKLLASYDVTDNSDMGYSLPSDVNVIDWNFDGYADYAFVGDMGGRIWRFDFDNFTSTSVQGAVIGGVIADFGGNSIVDNRRFFYPPDVALIKDESSRTFLNIAVGSGWRSHPLDTEVQDRFFVFRDPAVQGAPRDLDGRVAYSPITDADLFDATSEELTTSTLGEATNGWFINLTDTGEKVLSASTTVNGQLLFSSYVPDSKDQNLCSVSVGGGRLYALDIFTAGAVLDGNGDGITIEDRFQPLKVPGIPPPVSVMLLEGDEGKVSAGLESVEGVDFGPGFHYTHWAEE